eukprot:TRINITY_DN492_c0_g1_i1.p1 TRINITY_DN492_c0_g1~~TRINITY_DN492_c0_g1_i1.p1  ORF type:complete len:269 (+),score=62.16 TRINITY_DN492_c0_g1_i1:62-868(+)
MESSYHLLDPKQDIETSFVDLGNQKQKTNQNLGFSFWDLSSGSALQLDSSLYDVKTSTQPVATPKAPLENSFIDVSASTFAASSLLDLGKTTRTRPSQNTGYAVATKGIPYTQSPGYAVASNGAPYTQTSNYVDKNVDASSKAYVEATAKGPEFVKISHGAEFVTTRDVEPQHVIAQNKYPEPIITRDVEPQHVIAQNKYPEFAVGKNKDPDFTVSSLENPPPDITSSSVFPGYMESSKNSEEFCLATSATRSDYTRAGTGKDYIVSF